MVGVGCVSFGMPGLGMLLYSIGGGTIAYNIFTKSDDWKRLFEACRLYNQVGDSKSYPIILKKNKTTYGYNLMIKAPIGITSDDFIKKKLAIEQMLNCNIDIEFNKNIIIKVFENKLLLEYEFKSIKTKGNLKFPIGYSYRGIETIDLTVGEPHALLAGETGSGKSTLLRSILTSIIISKKSIDLHLIDLKGGVELKLFERCKNVISFNKNIDEAKYDLSNLLDEVRKRYDLFYKNNCVDIKDYNKNNKNKLKRKLIVIDEFSLLADEKGSIGIVEELAATARACGVHMILCTQRPDAKIINGRIKANVPRVIGLKTLNGLNSRIIIDREGLEKLRGKGHGILKSQGHEIEFQSMNISPEQAKQLLSEFYIQKNKNKTKENGLVNQFNFFEKL